MQFSISVNKELMIILLHLIICKHVYAQKCIWTGEDLQNPQSWNNPQNWNTRQLPSDYDDVIIEAFPQPLAFPIISEEQQATIHSLTIMPGAEIEIKGRLDITDNLTMSGNANRGSIIKHKGVINFSSTTFSYIPKNESPEFQEDTVL